MKNSRTKICKRCRCELDVSLFAKKYNLGTICNFCTQEKTEAKKFEQFVLDNINRGYINHRLGLVPPYKKLTSKKLRNTRIEIINEVEHLIIPSKF